MMDILKNIKDQLHGEITEAGFEGANIVLYTENERFFKEGEGKIKSIVEQIKKRRFFGFNLLCSPGLSGDAVFQIVFCGVPRRKSEKDVNLFRRLFCA